MIVDIFIPCFVDQLAPEIGFSMVKVLEKLGCEVRYNANQTCCGQPAYNAGYFEEAKTIAEKFLVDFGINSSKKSKNKVQKENEEDEDHYIVAPSASCTGMIRNSYENFFASGKYSKEYGFLQRRAFEFSEFLTDILEVNAIKGAKFPHKVVYHDACSALRECGISSVPRELLRNVEGLELVEMKDNTTCCGFGGTFAVKFQGISTGMAEQKVQNALDTDAEYIVSTDYSCLLHLEAFINKNQKPIKVIHIADILASGW